MATHPDNPKTSTDISVNDIDRAFDDGAPSDIAQTISSGTAMFKNTVAFSLAQEALEPLKEEIRNRLLVVDTKDLTEIYALFNKLNEIHKADYKEWIQKISTLLEIPTPTSFESMGHNECQYYVEQLVDYIKNQQVIVEESARANTYGNMSRHTILESASTHSLDTQKVGLNEDPSLLRRSTDHRPEQIKNNALDPDRSTLLSKWKLFLNTLFNKVRGDKKSDPGRATHKK